MTDFEEHYIKTEDGAVVHAWLLLHANAEALPTIVYFHGNAGNMGFRLPHGVNLYKQCRANVLLVDYRGYGASEGKPSEAGLLEDARAVLRHVRAHPRVAADRIVLYGKSLGGAVALALAEARPQEVAALVLENTFLSIPAMVDILLPYLSMVKGLILRIGWHNDRRVGRLAHPMLFISGLQDELVPPAHMKQLSRLATRSAWPQLYTVADGTHNDTMFRGGIAYLRVFRAFLEEHVASRSRVANATAEVRPSGRPFGSAQRAHPLPRDRLHPSNFLLHPIPTTRIHPLPPLTHVPTGQPWRTGRPPRRRGRVTRLWRCRSRRPT